MTNFKMTIRADCAVSASSPLPPSIKALAHWLSVGKSAFRQESTLPHLPASLLNKADFPFHQLASLLAFEWRAAGPPLSVTGGGCMADGGKRQESPKAESQLVAFFWRLLGQGAWEQWVPKEYEQGTNSICYSEIIYRTTDQHNHEKGSEEKPLFQTKGDFKKTSVK